MCFFTYYDGNGDNNEDCFRYTRLKNLYDYFFFVSDTRPLPLLSFLALASTFFDRSFSFQNIGSKYFLDNFKNLRNGAKKSDSGGEGGNLVLPR